MILWEITAQQPKSPPPPNLVNLIAFEWGMIYRRFWWKKPTHHWQGPIWRASGARPRGDRIVIGSILAKKSAFYRQIKKPLTRSCFHHCPNENQISTESGACSTNYSFFNHRVDPGKIIPTSYGYGKYATCL